MIYDFVIFDDDVSIHCPDHFFEFCGPDTRYLGYSKAQRTFENFSLHRYSSNFIIRRLFKFSQFLRIKPIEKWSSTILVYDDIAFALLLKVLGYKKISLRITHPKDLERMPRLYVTAIHFLLKYCIRGKNIATISPVLRRYYKVRFRIRSELWPSKVKLTANQNYNAKEQISVYSGTLKGRGSIKNIFLIMDQLHQFYGITSLHILAPELTNQMSIEITELSHNRDYKVIITQGASIDEIENVYKMSKFGIAYYDVRSNKLLKQNYPLKTLEYLKYGIIPVVNPINAHVDLEKKGFRMVSTDFSEPAIKHFIEMEMLQDIANANYNLLKRSNELVVTK